MKIKDRAKLRRILYNKYWFIKVLDNSNIFSHLIIIITVLLQYTILFIEYETFMKGLIYVSMIVTSLMIVILYLWFIALICVIIVKIYEYIKYFVLKLFSSKKNNKTEDNKDKK